MGQAVKVKAETSPDLQTLPLLDPVQLDRTTPEYRVPKPPEPRRKEGEREKIKIKHKAAPKTSDRRRPDRICLPVLTLWRERKQKRAESETCEARPGPGLIHAVQCDGTSTGITAAFTRLSWFPPGS